MTASNVRRLPARLALLPVVLAVAACAQPAERSAMVPDPIARVSATSPYHASVSSVTGYGGQETNPMWMSQISDKDFQAALTASLRTAGIMSERGRYRVRADILKLDQPMAGFDLDVSMVVRYNLIDAQGRIRLDRTITSTYHAEFGEAFAGVERLRKANEGAARENIRMFLAILGSRAPRASVGAVS